MVIRAFNAALALLLALGVTFGLFFLMQFLIAIGQEQPTRSEAIRIGDISIPEIQLQVMRSEPRPQEPDMPEQLPELPQQEFDSTAPVTDNLTIGQVNIQTASLDANASIGINDTEMLPIVIIQPQYPTRALTRGIEGWVHVMFTVTPTGNVVNPVVVDADPPEIFNNAALRAVERFRYNPRVVRGEPVAVDGVQYVLRFNISE